MRVFAVLPAAITALLTLTGTSAVSARQAAPSPAATAPAATAQCARSWTGRDQEITAYLASAAVTSMEAVPIGVTKPQRGTFAPGGPVARFAWKALPPSRRNGFPESYKAEIAAYHLDRLLGMDMVPPVVERTIDGKAGAAVLWIEGTTGWIKDKPTQGPEPEWSKQISRMKLFDQLIANTDRNQGNLLYDRDWHLFLIDHSRAFTTRTSADGIAAINTVDRRVWQKMDALTADDLSRALGDWLTPNEQKALLARRDRMRQAIATLVKQKGAGRVFLEE
jgi:hypothetical protein